MPSDRAAQQSGAAKLEAPPLARLQSQQAALEATGQPEQFFTFEARAEHRRGLTRLFALQLASIVLLAAVFLKTFTLTFDQFWAVVTAPRVVASYKLSFGMSLLAAAINANKPTDIASATAELSVQRPIASRRGGVTMVNLSRPASAASKDRSDVDSPSKRS